MAQQTVDFYTRFFQRYYMQDEQRADAAGFLAFWGKGGEDSTIFAPEDSIVDIDIEKSTGQELAVMVARGNEFTATNRKIGTSEDYTALSMDFGLIEDEHKLTHKQIQRRIAGEAPYSNMTEQMRMHLLALKHHKKSMGKIFRTHALLASQAILTGKHDQIIGTANVDKIYDFKRNASSLVTPTNTWDSVSADIMGDINNGCEYILANGYAIPDVMILGQGMLDALIKDDVSKELADNRRYELIQISQNFPVPDKYSRLVKAGFVPYGRYKTTKGYMLWMFTLPHNYKNLSGTVTKYLAEDKVLIASFDGRTDRYFGPRDSFKLTSGEVQWYNEMFGFNPNTPPLPMPLAGKVLDRSIYDMRSLFCDAYPMAGRKGVVMRTQSAPIYAPTEVDVYYTIENGLT